MKSVAYKFKQYSHSAKPQITLNVNVYGLWVESQGGTIVLVAPLAETPTGWLGFMGETRCDLGGMAWTSASVTSSSPLAKNKWLVTPCVSEVTWLSTNSYDNSGS